MTSHCDITFHVNTVETTFANKTLSWLLSDELVTLPKPLVKAIVDDSHLLVLFYYIINNSAWHIYCDSLIETQDLHGQILSVLLHSCRNLNKNSIAIIDNQQLTCLNKQNKVTILT